MVTRIIDFRPPRIAQLLVLLAALLHWATPLHQLHIYSSRALGLVLAVAGFSIMMWGWWLFRKYNTAICPSAPSAHLVTDGIYRLSRNPMYLGMAWMLLAIGVYVGSLPFYLAAVAFFLVMDQVFCPYEENKLASEFGESYLSYKCEVGRWL